MSPTGSPPTYDEIRPSTVSAGWCRSSGSTRLVTSPPRSGSAGRATAVPPLRMLRRRDDDGGDARRIGHGMPPGIRPGDAVRRRRRRTVSWTRTLAGIPVPGDGLRVQLWADGSLHGYSRTERTLAPAGRDARPVDGPSARRCPARSVVQRRSAAAGDDDGARARLDGPERHVRSSRPDAPSATLRLSWVARVATTGPLADSLRGLELYFDGRRLVARR
jgi:hypothetical protein